MQYDLISIIAARRGLPALRRLLSELPAGFGTPIVCLVQSHPMLAEELQAASRLRIAWAEEGKALEAGTVYLSAPGTSLVGRPDGTLSITPFGIDSIALNPVDQFLTSAASRHGDRLLAVVLAGFEQDGVAGSVYVRRAGGTLAILDRATGEYWGMAEAMVRAGGCDRVLTTREVAAALRGCFTSQDLLRCAEIQIRLGMLLESALEASGAGMGHISRRLANTGQLRIVVDRGVDAALFEHFATIPPGEDTASGRALLTRARAVIPDVLDDDHCAPRHPAARAFGFRAEHATPLFDPGRGELSGMLTTLYPSPHHVTPEEARAIDRVAEHAAAVLSDLPEIS